jgi:hypothetical protein
VELFRNYLEERIQYLRNTEWEAIRELDTIKVGTMERYSKWELINELTHRRHELEDALNFLTKRPVDSPISSTP